MLTSHPETTDKHHVCVSSYWIDFATDIRRARSVGFIPDVDNSADLQVEIDGNRKKLGSLGISLD